MSIQFFFAINIATGEAECFATKYLPHTGLASSRLKFWRINNAFEQIEKAKTVEWNNAVTNRHEEQLQAALGEKWQVLDFYNTLLLIQKSFTPKTK